MPDLGRPQAVPAPPGFREVDSGSLYDVWRLPPLALGGASSASALVGLRYERKALEHLASVFPALEARPWFGYRDANGQGRCSPDAVLMDADWPIVFELKLQHTPNAWWQLRRLYEPIVSHFARRVALVCEVTSSYDPSVPFPEEPDLLFSDDDLRSWMRRPIPAFGVFQLKV